MQNTRICGALTFTWLVILTVAPAFAQTNDKKPVGATTGGVASSQVVEGTTEKPAPPDAAKAKESYDAGARLWNAGKFAEAKLMFQAAVKADTSHALAHYMLGNAHLRDGEFSEARAALQTYLWFAPNGDKAAQVNAMLDALLGLPGPTR